MPLSDDMRHAAAILDGTDKSGRALPSAPGFYWSPLGHRLVVGASHAPALEQAVRAEVAIFGGGQLAFGVGVRFFNKAGEASPWAARPYSWHSLDPGKWPIPPVADSRLIPFEERFVELVGLNATACGEAVSRYMALTSGFAMAIRNRVNASKNMNFKPEWLKSNVAQIERLAGSLGDATATTDRFVGDLLPNT
jgi:hypothetical protein